MEEKIFDNNSDYVNYSVPGGEPAASPLPPDTPALPLTWRDAAGPALALALSLLYWAVFALDSVFRGYGPGLGVFVFTAAYFAAVFVMLGRRADRRGLPLTAAALVLALTCALYAHPGFTVLNCFVILALAAMAAFALSGQARFPSFQLWAIPEAIRLSVLALFTRIDRPFRAAARVGKTDKRPLIRALAAVLGTLALLAVVLTLLSSADMVFRSFFDGLRRWLETLDPGRFLWRLLRAVTLALFLASGLHFLREPAPESAGAKRVPGPRHAPPFLLPVLALDLVYAVFCAVQLRYLFGGAETAAMAGGWAEYARTGFFQLVAVAVISLGLCVLSAKPDRLAAKGGLALRIADAVMLALTALILVSALYRMRLYIAAFGLSVLRLMTLWGMLVIAVGILLAAWKLYRPGTAFWPGFFGFALGTWCLFCLAGPAGRAADYNVDAYLDGRLADVDVWYLEELSPDAAGALRRLAASSEEYDEAIRQVETRWEQQAQEASWAQWKLSFRHGE